MPKMKKVKNEMSPRHYLVFAYLFSFSFLFLICVLFFASFAKSYIDLKSELN